MKDSYSVLHINTQEHFGGASKVVSRLAGLQATGKHRVFQLFGKVRNKNFARYHSMVSKAMMALPHGKVLFDSFYRFGSIYTARLHQKIPKAIKRSYQKIGLLDYEYDFHNKLVENAFVKNSDVIHLHNIHGGYFDLFSLPQLSSLKPIVWTLHDMQSFTGHCAHSLDCDKWESGCGQCPYLNLYPKLEKDATNLLWKDKKWIYDQTKMVVITPSQWLKCKVERSILSSHTIEVVPNSIDTTLFKPHLDKKALREKYHLPIDGILIGCVADGGLSNPWKGGKYALEVITEISRKYRDVYFVEIGIHKKEEGSPLSIQIGYVEDEKHLAELYACLDIYLCTSIAENCPLVLIEALSCGLPLIAFDVCSMSEFITPEKNGFLIPFADISFLLRRLSQLIENLSMREYFSQFSRNFAKAYFCQKKVMDKTESIYSDLLSSCYN